jgi:hypothetical protein
MSENYYEKIAKMLGVELFQDFLIENSGGEIIKGCPYHFTDKGLFSSNNNQRNQSDVLSWLLEEHYVISKDMWETMEITIPKTLKFQLDSIEEKEERDKYITQAITAFVKHDKEFNYNFYN